MPTVTVDPQSGHLLVDGKPVATNNLGWAGSLAQNGMVFTNGGWFDPNSQIDESGQFSISRYTPQQIERMNGMVPVRQGVGGETEVIDPSQVIYDPELGFLSNPANVAQPVDSNLERVIGMVPAAVFTAGMGGLIGQGMGLWGDPFEALTGGGGSGAAPNAGATGVPPDSYWNMVADAGNVASDSGGIGAADMFGAGGLDPETLSGIVGGGGSAPSGWALTGANLLSDPFGTLGGLFSSGASSAMDWLSNPWNLARGGLTLAAGLGGNGQQLPSGSGSPTPWSGTPYDFFGTNGPSGTPSGGSVNPYTAAQLAALHEEDSMGYYGQPSVRSNYGNPYQMGGMGGIGTMMGMGSGWAPTQGAANPIQSMMGRPDPYGGGYNYGGINPGASVGGGRQTPGMGGYNYGGINPSANMGGGGMGGMRQILGSGSSGGMIPQTFDQGQGRTDPYSGGATGGINPSANAMQMGGVPKIGQDSLGQIRERLRPLMGSLVDNPNFGSFIERQAGGTSLDPSQFGAVGNDQYGRQRWQMGVNNQLGTGDAARVMERLQTGMEGMGLAGGGGPMNLWASQITGQEYNPANPYAVQGGAQDTRQQGRQPLSPALLAMMNPNTAASQQAYQDMAAMLARARR